MKKLILPLLIIFAIMFFLPSKADAQTRQECEKTRDRASYNCLLEFGKCYSPCVAETKDNMSCRNSCKQVENVCDKQVDADYKTCLGAIKKNSENPPKTEVSPQVQANTDCHGVFTKESNTCLKESTKCISSCVDKANDVASLTVDGGKVMDECTRSICDPASKACNDKAMANFRACGKSDKSTEAKKETPATSQPSQYPADIFEKIPITIGGWFKFASMGIELGEFLTGLTKGFTITDDAIIEDEQYEKEWDKYRESYNSLKSEGLTHEQIEATLQKPRRRDVSMSPQELEALKAEFPTGESITNALGITDTKLYSWETDSGALIKSTSWENIEFKKPVVDGDVTIRTVNLGEGEMEVKVRNANPAENKFGVDAGWLDVTVSRTHFWVSQSEDKKLAVVGVYEGEVEVKTKDGKVVTVKPDGDKPGVVVVTQKISPFRIAIFGLIVSAITFGVVLIIRRKFASKGFGKKKK